MSIRKPAVAGFFYPSNKEELKNQIESFLRNSSISFNERPKAIIVPHAGYIYSGQVAAFGYSSSKDFPVDNVVIVGPSHFFSFSGAALSPARKWQTPLGFVEINNSYFSNPKILKEMEMPHKKEHSIEVQVPFIQYVFPKTKIVPISTGIVDSEMLAKEIMSALSENDLLVVSSDLSHYYPYEEAIKIDEVANKSIPDLDFDSVENYVEACGKTGILVCMYIAKKKKWKGKLLSYANSGDTAGDKSSVVGYGCYAFF